MKDKKEDKGDEVLGTFAAAKMLGIGNSTVLRWAHAGLIKSFCTASGRFKFMKSDIIEHMEDSGYPEKLIKKAKGDI